MKLFLVTYLDENDGNADATWFPAKSYGEAEAKVPQVLADEHDVDVDEVDAMFTVVDLFEINQAVHMNGTEYKIILEKV